MSKARGEEGYPSMTHTRSGVCVCAGLITVGVSKTLI